MSEDRPIEEIITLYAALRLYPAGQVGERWLAMELEALGLSDEDGSLNDAMRLRPLIMEVAEVARKGFSDD
jgi:hypothetical protein